METRTTPTEDQLAQELRQLIRIGGPARKLGHLTGLLSLERVKAGARPATDDAALVKALREELKRVVQYLDSPDERAAMIKVLDLDRTTARTNSQVRREDAGRKLKVREGGVGARTFKDNHEPALTREIARLLLEKTKEQGPPRVEEPAVEEDPAGDAVGPTAAPPAVREKTASDGRRGCFAEADPRPSAGHRGRGRMLLLLVVLVVVAGVGGYALFREPPTRPAASRSAVVGEKALQQRFVVSLNRMLHRLADSGVEARRQLVKAKTGLKQAAAARKIASAYRATAGEVARLSAAPAQRAPARAISANLKRAGRAYADLAAAAKAQNVKRYDAARRAVDAEEAALRRQLLRSGLAMR